jgi:PAS domain S-box-containing protein
MGDQRGNPTTAPDHRTSSQRSTALVVLTVLALMLGFAFSGWCVALAVSMEGLRTEVADNVRLLRGLESVRSDLRDMESIVLDRAASPVSFRASWEEAFKQVQSDQQSLSVSSKPSAKVREQLMAVEQTLLALDKATEPLLNASEGDPGISSYERAFHRAHVTALNRASDTIGQIRIEQSGVSNKLANGLRSLFLVAVLSVATVIVLAVLFSLARRDAEKHRRAQAELRESERRLDSVLSAVPDIIFVLAADGEYREIFTAEAELLYRPAGELMGRTIHEMLPPEAARPIQDIIDRVVGDGEIEYTEYPLAIGERTKWFAARVAPFGNPDDPCVLWVARDITEARRAEENLRESEQRLESLVAAIPDLIFVLDAKGEYRKIYTSKSGLLYRPAEQVVGRTIRDVIPEAVAKETQAVIDRVLATGRPQTFEYPLCIRGEDRWFSARVAPFGEAADPCVLAVARDITDRVRAEAGLRESEARFRQLAENIDEVVSMAPAGSRGIEYASPAYEAIFGRSCQSLYDDPRSWQELIHPDDRQRIVSAFDAGAHLGEFDEEFRIVRDDGTTRWVRDRTFAVRDAENNLLRIAGLTQDITGHKLAEQELREREERFRSVVDTANDGVVVANEQGDITMWNKACEKIFGYTADEAIGQPLTLIIPERYHDQHRRDMKLLKIGRGRLLGRTTEQTGLRKDGTELPLELSVGKWQGPQGLFYTGIIRDVTSRKRAEASLRDSEQRFRSAFHDTAVGMVLVDPEGRFTSVNQSFCEMVGYSEEELLGRSFRDLTHPDDLASSEERMRKVLSREKTSLTMEKRCLRKDGSVLWAHTSVAAVLGEDGWPISCVIEAQDVTDRKRAQEALRDREGLLRQLTETIREVFWMTSADGREMIYVSPAYEEIWGRTCESLYARPTQWAEAIHDEDRARVTSAFYETPPGSAYDQEYRIVRPDGTTRWIRDRGFPIRNEAGEIQRIAGIAEDISELVRHRDQLETMVRERTEELVAANKQLRTENAERQRAEKIQRDRSSVLQLLAGGAPIEDVLSLLTKTIEELDPQMLCSVLILDDDKKRLRHGAAPSLPAFYNEAIDGLEIGPSVGSCGTAAFTGERVIVEDVMTHPNWAGYEELARRASVRACWSEPIISSVGEVLGTFAMYYREPRGPDADDLEVIRSAASLAGIALEHKKAAKELEASNQRLRVRDRLASLGTLTAGLGHDMNNVLFPIRCRLEALDWQRVPRELQDLLLASRTTVNYLKQLSDGLRLLAVDPEDAEASGQATALAPWWRQVQPLMANLIRVKVKLDTDLPEDLPPVAIAPHRLTQAVMNLVVNASEAMPEGGRILIRARPDRTRRRVRVTVIDDGVGMTDEVRQRAFDPFFTTKKRSLSTGFGLSLVHSLVRMSRGTVEIASRPGRGTTVTLHLRTAAAPAAPAAGAAPRGKRAAVTLSDRRTAAWVTIMLEAAGYIVRSARNGDPSDTQLWVTEANEQNLREARDFAGGNGAKRIIVLGPADPEWRKLGAVVVEDATNRNAIHAAVDEVTPVEP